MLLLLFFFFFQAEDGIRDVAVTGVQTCALPICDNLTQFRRRRDRGVLRITDEPLERGFAQRLIASRQRAHRAHEVADARNCGRLAADAQLGATRHDLHAELALDSIDVRLIVTCDEHHLVGIRDEDRDLRCRSAHDARSFRSAATTPETTFPSARPFVSAMTFGITTFVSCGPFAPVSPITLLAISWIFASSSCAGRYALMNASSCSSFCTRSGRSPLRNASIESRRILACFVSTSVTATSSRSPGLCCASHARRADSSLPSATSLSTAAPRRAFSSVCIAARRKRMVSRRRVSPERIAATRSLSSRCFNCALMRLAPPQRLRRFASLRLRRAAGLS